MGKKSRLKKNRSVKQVGRSVALSPELVEKMKAQAALFRAKFGRDPLPDDPVFFDPHSDRPEPSPTALADSLDAKIIEAMAEIGVDPSILFAYRKTGRIVTQQNEHLLTAEELKEWDDALSEYERLSGSQQA